MIDRWLVPDHLYFKVRAQGDIYILPNDIRSDMWELTLFERAVNPQAR